jgi:hypothetical protein
VAAGKTAESFVGMLAAKTPTDGYPNVFHPALVQANLMGQEVQMDGRVILAPGKVMRSPDGKIGIHIEEFPEAAAFLRWKNGEFLEIEREVARRWRRQLAAHDPSRTIEAVRDLVVPAGTKITDLAELKGAVDSFLERTDKKSIALALDVLGVPYYPKRVVLAGWAAVGYPPLEAFAPYARHVVSVDLPLLPRRQSRVHLGRAREQQGGRCVPLLPAFCDGLHFGG